jgi:hypothetical protein
VPAKVVRAGLAVHFTFSDEEFTSELECGSVTTDDVIILPGGSIVALDC